jgi:hypothetical protein
MLPEYHRMRAEDKSSSILNKEWRQEYNAGRSRSQILEINASMAAAMGQIL